VELLTTMEMLIGERLKLFRNKYGIPMPEVSKATGISKENLYKWERGVKPSNMVLYNKLKEYLDKMELAANDDMLYETAMEFKTQLMRTVNMRVPLTGQGKPVPYTSSVVTPGSIAVINQVPELIVERIDVPSLGDIEGLVVINSDSMEPTFKKGSRAAIRRLRFMRILNWGDFYYVIDENWEGGIKRIYPGDTPDSIKLIVDHPDQIKYPPIQRPWEQIVSIFKVVAVISTY
jgi:transcriptional regulator with XRE-family HTH domain